MVSEIKGAWDCLGSSFSSSSCGASCSSSEVVPVCAQFLSKAMEPISALSDAWTIRRKRLIGIVENERSLAQESRKSDHREMTRNPQKCPTTCLLDIASRLI